jgi:hypothetical protein
LLLECELVFQQYEIYPAERLEALDEIDKEKEDNK